MLGMRPSPFDLRLAARTLALSVVASMIVLIVEAITDERGVATAGTGGRSIGVLPLMPVACAVAVVIALAPMTNSGELRALAALGCSPWRARFAAIATAIALSGTASLVIATRGTDVAALFPPAVPASDFRVDDDRVSFISARRRIRVHATPEGDVLERTGPPPEPVVSGALDRKQILGAAAAIALAGIALSVWAGAPIRRGAIRMLLTLTAWGVSEVLVFQAAGARALHPLATAAPSLGLLLLVLIEDHLARRLSRDEAWI
jgi:hypothetical protein